MDGHLLGSFKIELNKKHYLNIINLTGAVYICDKKEAKCTIIPISGRLDILQQTPRFVWVI